MKIPFEIPVKKTIKRPYANPYIEDNEGKEICMCQDELQADYIVTAINSNKKYEKALEKIRDTETHDDKDCDPYGALGICKDIARDVLEEAEKL